MSSLFLLDYAWIDATLELRYKTRALRLTEKRTQLLLKDIPTWDFDGSSTGQADGDDSDCILIPAQIFPDAYKRPNRYLILCEVFEDDGVTPHRDNTRALARQNTDKYVSEVPWFGLEQEYTLFVADRPLGFPLAGYPEPQGKYYCSLGSGKTFGRAIAEEHLQACINSNLAINGINGEVMPGQWEFQVGGPGANAVVASDHLWVARFLLHQIAEKYNFIVSLDPKPADGDWNGAGCHTNFSTSKMRQEGGIEEIISACEKLSQNIETHLQVYGEGIERRLTGQHETCSYAEFKWGVADRSASVRIPRRVDILKRGYLEDRRPNANCDPYLVTSRLLKTVCS